MKQSLTNTNERPDLVSVDEMTLVDANGDAVSDDTLSYQCKSLSGGIIDFKNPQNCNYTFFDIIKPLSQNCRYNGQVFAPVYVLDHSYWVYQLFLSNYAQQNGLSKDVTTFLHQQVPAWLRLQALLHDAPEAFMGDMIRPLKRNMPKFIEFEDAMFANMMTRLSLPTVLDPRIVEADTQMLHIEQHVFRGQPAKPYGSMSMETFKGWCAKLIAVIKPQPGTYPCNVAAQYVNILSNLMGDEYRVDVTRGTYGTSPKWVGDTLCLSDLKTNDWFNRPINSSYFPVQSN